MNAVYRQHRICVEPAQCTDGAVRLYWSISNAELGVCANGVEDLGVPEKERMERLARRIDHELARDTPWSPGNVPQRQIIGQSLQSAA